MPDDEWIVVTACDKKRVTRKAGARCRPQSYTGKCLPSVSETLGQSSILVEGDLRSHDALHNCLEKCSDIVMKLDFLAGLHSTVQRWSTLTENRSSGHVKKIVVYGIGNFSKTKTSYYSAPLWQLSLALCLRKLLSSDDCSTVSIDFYDPCTTVAEAHFLSVRLKVHVLTSNDQGNYPIRNAKTLFFMPHCPSQLYENVVWSNFFNLSQVLFVGNSLRSLGERNPSFGLLCLKEVLPFLQEFPLLVSTADSKKGTQLGNFVGAWNDTYVSYYPAHSQGSSENCIYMKKWHRPYECLTHNSVDTELL